MKVAETLGEYGLISGEFYNRLTNCITGCISTAPRVIGFLNGDYLEIFGSAAAKRIVSEAAARHGVDYELFSNVVIVRGKEVHELDMVFRVGDKLFWSEIKSGKFSDFDTYRKLGIQLGVNPDRHIMLVAEKTDDAAAVASWLYQFYVANIDSFDSKLNEMIDKAFNGGNDND